MQPFPETRSIRFRALALDLRLGACRPVFGFAPLAREEQQHQTREDPNALAAVLPDPGSPGFPMSVGAFVGFLATAYALGRRESREDVQWKALLGGFAGMVVGLLVYGLGLATGLY